VALLWLGSLFTAYQAVLFLPIVYLLTHEMALPKWKRSTILVLPVFLLALYVLSNPLALASFLNAGTQNASLPLAAKLNLLINLWGAGGSLVLSTVATIFLVQRKQWTLLLCLVLVFAFAFLSYRAYYAILFTPIFIVALHDVRFTRHQSAFLLAVHIVVTAQLVVSQPLSVMPSRAEQTMEVLNALLDDGTVLIEGPFGHEWQYASRFPVRRYRPSLLPPCAEVAPPSFLQLDAPVAVWVPQTL
jgi:hypothetical protein